MQSTLTPRRSTTLALAAPHRREMAAPPAAVRRACAAGATGPRRRHRPGKRPAKLGAPRLSAATLERLEDALIDSLLDTHPNRDRAMGRLLRDVNRAVADGSPTGFPRLHWNATECTPARLARIEELLVGAVLEGHPKRGESLDRLLHGLAKNNSMGEPAPDPAADAALDPDAVDQDNDFDGLG